ARPPLGGGGGGGGGGVPPPVVSVPVPLPVVSVPVPLPVVSVAVPLPVVSVAVSVPLPVVSVPVVVVVWKNSLTRLLPSPAVPCGGVWLTTGVAFGSAGGASSGATCRWRLSSAAVACASDIPRTSGTSTRWLSTVITIVTCVSFLTLVPAF